MRARDSQRKRVFNSDWCIYEWAEVKGMSVAECKDYIDRTLKHLIVIRPSWRPMLTMNIRVKDGRGTRIARAWYGAVSLPKWARTPSVILHELAHVINSHTPGYLRPVSDPFAPKAPHGPEFAGIMLTLVRSRMGDAAGKALLAGYRKYKVRYVLPKWA